MAMTQTTFERIARRALFFDEGHGFDVFGLHPPSLARAVQASRLIYERYFRVDSRGAECIPETGPVIVIANHGGILPVDAAMLCLDLLVHTEPPRIPRAIADHFVPRLPLVSALFARMGVVNGTRANVRRLLERGELLALWPEGVSGPAKRFRQRYRIQAWRVGFAELAIRYGATIIPAAIIGAEESWPVLAKLRRVQAFGSPYLPLPVTPLPLPVHYHIQYGVPIRAGHSPEEADDPHVVQSVAARARTELERLIQDARYARRGVFR